MPKVETNPSDDKLREYILTDDELQMLETRYAGYIRVLSVKRYQCRIQTGILTAEFTLRKFDGDYRTLTLAVSGHILPLQTELGRLCYHRAAEAMLALRKGHMEYRRARQARKFVSQAA